VAEEVYSHIISIPIYPGLTDAQQDEVIQKIKALLSKDMP
jgi:dTDP-4-amino-4,6-dideoxygalactose transaminase